MEYTRAEWTRYGSQMGEHNSYLKLFVTQTSFDGLLQFELCKFHCTFK